MATTAHPTLDITSRLDDWAHPALTVLPWEHTEADRVGVHGRALWVKGRREDYGPVYISAECYCGWTSGDCDTNREAFDALVAHAVQQGETPEPFECDRCYVQPDGTSQDGTTCPCSVREPVGGCRCVASPAEWMGPAFIRAEIAVEEA